MNHNNKTDNTTPDYSRGYRWYVVFLMMGIYACLLADRALLSVLVEPIKAEFGVSDTTIGFVGGVLMAGAYAVFSIPFGWLSDRINRRKLLVICMSCWSVMLPITGLARNIYHLAVAQLLATIGESGCPSSMSSLISDLFPREKRGLAIAIWISGISIGMFFGFALGGYLAETFGWRITFMLFAVPGIVFVLLLKLTVHETPRGMADGGVSDESVSPTLRDTLQFFKTQKALQHAAYGLCLTGCAVIGSGYWLTAFFIRTHEINLGQAGLVLGVIMGITGIVGAPAGGVLMDRLGQRDIRWHAWFPCLLLLLNSIPMTIMFQSANLNVVYVACFLWNFIGSSMTAISIAIISNLAAAQYRGLTISVMLVLFTLVGRGLGSQIVGISSDWIDHTFGLGENSLRYACTGMVVFLFWAAAHFRICATHLQESYRKASMLEKAET